MVFFVLLTLLVSGTAGSAFAQMVNLDAIKKLPHYASTLPDAQFTAQTVPYTDSSPQDKSLSYALRLPAGWRRGDTEKLGDGGETADAADQNVLGTIARFYGSDGFGQSSRIEISALRLSYDISLRNWFINYIVSNGFTLEGLEQSSPNRIDCLYVVLDGDQSYVVRSVAQMNGAHVAVISYYMPEEDFNARRAMQEKVLDSFHFLNADTEKPEDVHTYAFLDLVRFDYPASWTIDSPNIESPNDMSVSVLSDKERAAGVGEIDVHILGATGNVTLTQKLQSLKGELGKIGVAPGNLLEAPQDYNTHPEVYYKRIEIYEAHANSNQYQPQEYWLAVMAESHFYYIVTMLTPSRSADFMHWARNSESFRTIVESLRP